MIIYVLKLEKDKFYIGKTSDLKDRLKSHFNGNGSAWTKKYKPVSVLREIRATDYITELSVTLFYMKKYGIENTRGSLYCSISLSEIEVKEIEKYMRSDNDLCFKCGSDLHFSKDCDKIENMSYFRKFLSLFCLNKKHNILRFGKHKGYTYDYVLKNDPSYCKWIENTDSNFFELKKFKNWLNKNVQKS